MTINDYKYKLGILCSNATKDLTDSSLKERTQNTVDLSYIINNDKRYSDDNLNKHLSMSFITRYAFIAPKDRSAVFGKKNKKLLLDNYISYLFSRDLGYQSNILAAMSSYVERYRTKDFTLSRFFERWLRLKRIPLEQQLKNLGYNLKDIKKDLLAVKKKKLDIVSIGYGGMMCNVFENLIELCEILNINNIFHSISIFEQETLEASNMLRLNTAESFSLLTDNSIINRSNNTRLILGKLSLINRGKLVSLASTSLRLYNNYFRLNEFLHMNHKNLDPYHCVYIGAPDFETRQIFAKKYLRFLALLHQNDNVSIIAKPIANTASQVETYGSIKLAQFFMNCLVATVEFIKILATRDNLDEASNEVLFDKTLNTASLNFTGTTNDYSTDITFPLEELQR
jgi:hypothetical protein|nr:MAG TPA: hypothetical protein [Caudoviricetes sp.]